MNSGRPAPSAPFDWAMAVVSLWLSGGILIDAWYHFHYTVESFFEPAHALLYAGLLASYLFTGCALLTFRWQGYPLRRALPIGYELTVAGLAVTLAGGVLDMIKHVLFGFERGFDALVSPTHLLIGMGMLLIVTGPIRAALMRRDPPRTLTGQLPMLLSLGSVIELVHWGTQFVFLSDAETANALPSLDALPHDTLALLSLGFAKQSVGLLAVIVQSILVTGPALFLARHVRPARGALVTLLVVGNTFVAAAHANYPGQFWAVIAASAVAGACGELFAVGPEEDSPSRWLGFSFCMPAAYWATFLAVLGATMRGLWWPPSALASSVLFAGLTGALIGAIARRRETAPC